VENSASSYPFQKLETMNINLFNKYSILKTITEHRSLQKSYKNEITIYTLIMWTATQARKVPSFFCSTF